MNEHKQIQSNKYLNNLLSEGSLSPKTMKHKYCFLYVCGVLSLFILLFINNFFTSANFQANKYVSIQIELACNNALDKYEQCLEKDKNDICIDESTLVEQCYNSVFSINKLCFIYISEFHLCKLNNKSCYGIASDFIECANKFKGIMANELLALIK